MFDMKTIIRYGSIRFQKEQVVKKQQVFKYLLRLWVVRCIRPDKVVSEIMRFWGKTISFECKFRKCARSKI